MDLGVWGLSSTGGSRGSGSTNVFRALWRD